MIFDIPDNKKVRVIIDTDAACEADDPFAIVQALLSPKLIVKGICATHFVDKDSVGRSYKEIETILDAMDMDVPVFMGQKGPLSKDNDLSDASKFIINEALKDDEKPLFVLAQGAITNVAKAIMEEPKIKDRFTLIWIGTHGAYYGAAPFREFNSGNDVKAANLVLKEINDLWLVPSYVYTTILIGIAEIKSRIAPLGKIGKHLYENLMAYNNSEFAGWTQGESWSLGDSPAVAIALNPMCGRFEYVPAPFIDDDTSSKECKNNRKIRIYKDVDSRYILEDLIAKLELFTQKAGREYVLFD